MSAFTLISGAFSQWTFTYTPPAGTAIVQFALQNFDANPSYVDDVTFTTGNTNAATTVTSPAGWTAATSNATTGVGLPTFTHVAAAADPVSWSFGLSNRLVLRERSVRIRGLIRSARLMWWQLV